MRRRGLRIALKLLWAAFLVFLLVNFSTSHFDFIYRVF